ncbi:optineurin isoform X2 [Belonocnema kinseyi]|uniref:optineurin isoform X2 n=1 Tax=Belonocnema kinseyi TaxID=2817044 RepID=UPI00143D9C0F|nr:optineurin isoform X2 [Belonocnema kinseyi]
MMSTPPENARAPFTRDDLTWSMCEVDPATKSYIASEDHLQSLGLTVDNGKPRFKLNEPCLSLAASSICAPSTVEDYNSSQSFVVLSHPSLEAVQVQSLANYEKIQEKTASIDYNSVICNMSPIEIENKLSEMLLENVKLKETLAENTEAMKKQFNSLATFQEEVFNVHQNHKQKFAETRELINQLKKENFDLKMQISGEETKPVTPVFELKKTTENQSLQTSVSDLCNCSSRQLELEKLLEKTSQESTANKGKFEIMMKELAEAKELIDRLSRELVTCTRTPEKVIKELTESNENYKKELAASKEHCEKLSEDVEKYLSLSNLMRLQLKQYSESSKKSESMSGMDRSSNSSDFIVYCPSPVKSDDSQNLIKECCEKDKEISFLRELVTNLEQQIVSICKDVYIPIQPSVAQEQTDTLISRSEARQQLIQGVKSYSEKMEDLVDSFSLQSSRYVRIQECLKECANILHNFETSSENEASASDNSALATYRNILTECRKKLVDEQLENIADRQKWIKVQDQLQKIFSDYKSALYELEITQEENKKLSTIHDKNIEERLQQAKDLEKLLAEERKALDEAKSSLTLERLALCDEKKSVDELRESIVATQINYNANLEKLEQERLSLVDEKSAIDRQSKLYEDQENALMTEKKALMRRCEEFSERVSLLEHQLKKSCELGASDKEDLMVLRAQLDIFRSDYEQEKEAKKEVIREKNKLVEQIQGLTEKNQELRKDVDRLRQQSQRLQPRPTSERTEGPVKSLSCTLGVDFCGFCRRESMKTLINKETKLDSILNNFIEDSFPTNHTKMK